MKLAILQMADTQEIETTTAILRAAGYETRICGDRLLKRLQSIGCDTLIPHKAMLSCGYPELLWDIPYADVGDLDTCDLFVGIKYRNLQKIWEHYPRLRNRSIWKRVNGARPENAPGGGEEVDVDCPVVTANLWYGTEQYNASGRNYVHWPPYPRQGNYDPRLRNDLDAQQYGAPYCLCHRIEGWGFKAILDECIDMGVQIYGNGSPAGLLHHDNVPNLVSRALCLVHLKSVDCPGWALYEAMLGGCPVICANLLIERMRGWDLFEPGVTCLAFGPPGDETGRGDMEFDRCVQEIRTYIDMLKDPEVNRRIGLAGRARLLEVMWDARHDGEEFRQHMERQFGDVE